MKLGMECFYWESLKEEDRICYRKELGVTSDDDIATKKDLAAALRKLGLKAGHVIIVHSSLSSLRKWICGGATAVIEALKDVVTAEGTIVMPTHTPNLSDPQNWRWPPVPTSWIPVIQGNMPPYSVSASSCRKSVGIIPDTFRQSKDVLRSCHPQVSFAAWGKHAQSIIDAHDEALMPILKAAATENTLEGGEEDAAKIRLSQALSPSVSMGVKSPLSRIYELDGLVLLLGVPYEKNTSLHLSEALSGRSDSQLKREGAPMIVCGKREWVNFEDIDWETDDFDAIGLAFEAEMNGRDNCGPNTTEGEADDNTWVVRKDFVLGAESVLMRQRSIVDFGVEYMKSHTPVPNNN